MTNRPEYKVTEHYGIKTLQPVNILPDPPHSSTAIKVLKIIVLWVVLLGGLVGLSAIANSAIGDPDLAKLIIFVLGMCVGSFGMTKTQAVWSEW